jgi:hypothetical protein
VFFQGLQQAAAAVHAGAVPRFCGLHFTLISSNRGGLAAAAVVCAVVGTVRSLGCADGRLKCVERMPHCIWAVVCLVSLAAVSSLVLRAAAQAPRLDLVDDCVAQPAGVVH